MLSFEFTPRTRLWLVLACLAAIVISAIGAPSLSFTNDSRVFFAEDNPERAALERLEQSFDVAQTAVLALAPKSGIAAGREGGALSVAGLSALADAARRARDLPDIAAINSPLSTPLPRWTAGRLEVSVLLDADALPQAELARRILAEPLFRNWLVSPDGYVTAIMLNLALPVGDSAAVDRAVTLIKEMIAGLESRFDWVIIDTPPILATSDAQVIHGHTAAGLLVVRAGVSSVRALRSALKHLTTNKLLISFLNESPTASQTDYDDYYKVGERLDSVSSTEAESGEFDAERS